MLKSCTQVVLVWAYLQPFPRRSFLKRASKRKIKKKMLIFFLFRWFKVVQEHRCWGSSACLCLSATAFVLDESMAAT